MASRSAASSAASSAAAALFCLEMRFLASRACCTTSSSPRPILSHSLSAASSAVRSPAPTASSRRISASDCAPSDDSTSLAAAISLQSSGRPASLACFSAASSAGAFLALTAFLSASSAASSALSRSSALVAFLTPGVSGMPILVAFLSAFSMRPISRDSAAACSSSSVSFSSTSLASSSLAAPYSGWLSALMPSFLHRLSAACRPSSTRSVTATASASIAFFCSSSSSLSAWPSLTISSSRPSSLHVASAADSASSERSFIAFLSALRAAFSASMRSLSDTACLYVSVSVTYTPKPSPCAMAAMRSSSERAAMASCARARGGCEWVGGGRGREVNRLNLGRDAGRREACGGGGCAAHTLHTAALAPLCVTLLTLSFLTAAFSFSIRSRSARASVTTGDSNTMSSACLTADLSCARSRALIASCKGRGEDGRAGTGRGRDEGSGR
jgi:hypothetical protein